jgi:hypothetical protein
VFVFALVFTASLGMVAKALKGNQFAINELTAQYLATEGLEVMDALRSDQVIVGTWVQSLLSICSDGCAVDPTPLGGMSAVACVDFANGCSQLNRAGSGAYSLYTHEAGTETVFRRIVSLNQSTEDPTAIIIHSEVRWVISGLPERSIVVRKVIKDWY